MHCQQLSRARRDEAPLGRPLMQVHVGAAVPFYNDRPVVEDRNVPANKDSVAECPVSSNCEPLDLIPPWQLDSFDPCPAVRMTRQPTKLGIETKVTGPSKPAALDCYLGRNASRMDIVDRPIVSDRRSKNG